MRGPDPQPVLEAVTVGDVAEIILWTCGLIAALAAALKGLSVIWRVFVEGARRARVIDELTDEEGWPNGASSLKESHRDIYNRVAAVDLKVDELRSAVEQVITGR